MDDNFRSLETGMYVIIKKHSRMSCSSSGTLKKMFYLADVLKHQKLQIHFRVFLMFSIFPILECQQRYSWKMIWQQLWNMTNSAKTSKKKLLNSQMNDPTKIDFQKTKYWMSFTLSRKIKSIKIFSSVFKTKK